MARMPTIVLEGPFYRPSSFAVVNREIALALLDRDDVNCWIAPTDEPEASSLPDPRLRRLATRIWRPGGPKPAAWIRHRFPPGFKPAPAPLVWYQPWEFGSLPVDWVEASGGAAEIWAPSRAVQRGMIQSGLDPARIHRVPYGVDPRVFRPDAQPLRLETERTFRFLFVGGTIPRKGIDVLLEAYALAFGPDDDVCLVIKDVGTRSFYADASLSREIGSFQLDPAHPAVLYLDRQLPAADLAGLYTACDCLVHPSRGEGYGLPVVEAMAAGLPVIVPDQGALAELVPPEAGYLVPSRIEVMRERRVQPYVTVGQPYLVLVSAADLAAAMRRAFEDRLDLSRKGRAAAGHARARHTWADAAAVLAERVRNGQGGSTPRSRHQALRLGLDRFQKGDPAGAATLFAEVVRRRPADADARYNLAVCLLELGEPERAAAELCRYLQHLPERRPGPEDARVAVLLGTCLALAGDAVSACAAFRLALEADPGQEIAGDSLRAAEAMAAGGPDLYAGGWYRQFLVGLGAVRPSAPGRPAAPQPAGAPLGGRASGGAARGEMSLIWRGDLYGLTGYGDETRGWVRRLLGGRFRLRLETGGSRGHRDAVLEPGEAERFADAEATEVDPAAAVLVWHFPPTQVRPDRPARVRVCRTMFETDSLPRSWVRVLNAMDEVWVPGEFNRETFAAAGVRPDRLRVIPMGIDTVRFSPEAPPMALPARRGFTFLSNFDWGLRKGWDLLLRAYVQAFSPDDDVTLVLKLSQTHGQRQEVIERRVLRFIQETLGLNPERTPDILLLSGNIPGYRMPSLYTACDAFVLPSRGEGWGRPYLEAMACGLPTIGTRWSGNLMFMTDENSYLVDVEALEPVPAAVDAAIYRGQRWARPSVEHLAALLREVFSDPDAARARGRRARVDACTRWSWDRVARDLERELLKFW